MSTIGSSISAAGQCGLAYNEAITANNEKVIAQIELNQVSSQAANQLNLAGAKATEASGLSRAEQQRQTAFGSMASAIGGGVAGFGLIGMEASYANKADIAARNASPNSAQIKLDEVPPAKLGDVELDTIPPKLVAPTTGDAATNSAGTVVANNNNVDVDAPTGPPVRTQAEQDAIDGARTPVERVRTLEEIKEARTQQEIAAAPYTKVADRFKQTGQFLPGAITSIAQSSGQLAASNEQKNQAEADAMAIVANGLSQLASKNADAATQAQNAAESNKDSLIKALEAMVLANRAG